jgi:hypothetical protein
MKQARWAEYLFRYYFKLAYRTGRFNEQADALSQKLEDTLSQDRIIVVHWTQVLLPWEKVMDKVVWNLQPALIEPVTNQNSQAEHIIIGDMSLELVDKLLTANRTSSELKELWSKVRSEKEGMWHLKDGLLLWLGKLYVSDEQLMLDIPLRTAFIREAHD